VSELRDFAKKHPISCNGNKSHQIAFFPTKINILLSIPPLFSGPLPGLRYVKQTPPSWKIDPSESEKPTPTPRILYRKTCQRSDRAVVSNTGRTDTRRRESRTRDTKATQTSRQGKKQLILLRTQSRNNEKRHLYCKREGNKWSTATHVSNRQDRNEQVNKRRKEDARGVRKRKTRKKPWHQGTSKRESGRANGARGRTTSLGMREWLSGEREKCKRNEIGNEENNKEERRTRESEGQYKKEKGNRPEE